MWITKTEFIGSDGNKTIEINESTDEKYANLKKEQQLERWYKILVDSHTIIPDRYTLISFFEPQDRATLMFDIIQATLTIKNKRHKPKFENKFNIEVYEESKP